MYAAEDGMHCVATAADKVSRMRSSPYDRHLAAVGIENLDGLDAGEAFGSLQDWLALRSNVAPG